MTNSAAQASRNLEAALQAGLAGAHRAVVKVGQQITADVRASLSNPAGPSAPGTAPARVTGALQKSYTTTLRRDARGRYVAVSSDDPGATPLEFGRSDARARPHLRPAVSRAVPTITPTVAAGWSEAVRDEVRRQGR